MENYAFYETYHNECYVKLCITLIPCGRAELPDIIPGGFAQLPFFAADICPLAEENFFALRRDVFKRFKGVIG